MEKRREVRHRTEHLGEWLPLGVKFPVSPHSKYIFTRGKLGKELHRPSGYFNLEDPYCRQLSTEYNSLHDPHLKYFFNRKDNFQRLKKEGFITSDGKVVCTLKEFNDYRNYLAKLKLDTEAVAQREKERLQAHLARSKDTSRVTDSSCPLLRLQQAQKQVHPSPPKHRPLSFKSEGCRREKGAWDKAHTKPQPEIGHEGAKLPWSIRRICQAVRGLSPELNCGRPVAKLPAQRGRMGSYLTEDSLSSTSSDFSSEPVPPAHPKPSAYIAAWRKELRLKLLGKEPQTRTPEARA